MDSKQELYVSELPLTTTYVVNPIENRRAIYMYIGMVLWRTDKVATLQDIDTALNKHNYRSMQIVHQSFMPACFVYINFACCIVYSIIIQCRKWIRPSLSGVRHIICSRNCFATCLGGISKQQIVIIFSKQGMNLHIKQTTCEQQQQNSYFSTP